MRQKESKSIVKFTTQQQVPQKPEWSHGILEALSDFTVVVLRDDEKIADKKIQMEIVSYRLGGEAGLQSALGVILKNSSKLAVMMRAGDVEMGSM